MVVKNLEPNRVIWEQGSEFHLFPYINSDNYSVCPWKDNATFWTSGRSALLAILKKGYHHYGWKRIWVPSYYCSDVINAIRQSGLKVQTYTLNPEILSADVPSGIKLGDVALIVNIFGIFTKKHFESFFNESFAAIIEDHTHDPWSSWAYESEADWCFASLRKTLPLPDGAVCWSPQNHLKLEAPPVSIGDGVYLASLEKLASMVLKGYYLWGNNIQKEVYRQLSVSGEQRIFYDELVSISPWSFELFKTFPFKKWRKKRLKNWYSLVNELENISSLKILYPPEFNGVCPFSVVIVFSTPRCRDIVRAKLISHGIYPSILWPFSTDVQTKQHISSLELSKRILSIHCDMRYCHEDMTKVGQRILQSLQECNE